MLKTNAFPGDSDVTEVLELGKMKTAPEVREHHNPGPDHTPNAKSDREASLSISTPVTDDHSYTKDQLIGRLDEAHHYYIESRHARVQWMVLARNQGLSFHEIGVAVGITENAARKAVHRAVTDGQG